MTGSQFDYGLLRAFGADVFISAAVEIRRPHLVSVGSHVAIDSGFYCTVAAELGDYIHIGPYVSVIGGERGRLHMAPFSSVAAGCRLACSSDAHLGAGLPGPTIPYEYRDDVIYGTITFEMFSALGMSVVVHPDVTLGEGSMVGSCSLVTADTEPWTIYYGIPARSVHERPREKMIAAAKAMGYL